jgi:3-dehydroquinate dehydratase-2
MKRIKVFVLNGPNLNLIGKREPEVYGTGSLNELLRMLKRRAKERGAVVYTYQSNHEGSIIDRIHTLPRRNYKGIIVNPGALTHYSYALRDALKAVGLPAVEVHLSDIEKREDFRKVSVIRDVCIAQVKGLGPQGYVKALELLLDHLLPS